MRRPFVVGNWKMNLLSGTAASLAKGLTPHVPPGGAVDVAVCPAFPYLQGVGSVIAGSGIQLGAQNCYFEKPGAFTGEVSPEMLLDLGCKWVILGHSERRHVLGETNAVISQKTRRALALGLSVILCVGETRPEREANKTEAVLDDQMQGSLEGVEASQMGKVVIAYEPVWAIGTGLTATSDQAESAHRHLRTWLQGRYNADVAEKTLILYGGSVKAKNAKELQQQPNVDGALVGGASLEVDEFSKIIEAARQVATASA